MHTLVVHFPNQLNQRWELLRSDKHSTPYTLDGCWWTKSCEAVGYNVTKNHLFELFLKWIFLQQLYDYDYYTTTCTLDISNQSCETYKHTHFNKTRHTGLLRGWVYIPIPLYSHPEYTKHPHIYNQYFNFENPKDPMHLEATPLEAAGQPRVHSCRALKEVEKTTELGGQVWSSIKFHRK